MTSSPIRNDDDLKRAFRRLEKIFQAGEGTAQADERDVLVTLVEAYENKHYDFGPADPVEAIKFRMEQGGLTPRDLEPFIGPSGRVSEVNPVRLHIIGLGTEVACADRVSGARFKRTFLTVAGLPARPAARTCQGGGRSPRDCRLTAG